MFLLDTHVVSELRKRNADVNVLHWSRIQLASSLFVSSITILELETGILRIERNDPTQGAALRMWLDHHVLNAFAGRTLSIDTQVAKRCGHLDVHDPRSECAGLIAATTLLHVMMLVTRNTVDFEFCRAALLNPWISQLNEETAHHSSALL
ncbi:twitching motility protein PilT [Pseudomonas coronafaciens pv. porri]|uniref:Twitching motility protein PilT n=1 Tax=Pseudomonas coronafaciens pv. porri TaxID=83964 RepID=A0ABR5JVG6_9PSED|nr:type II toxin-antitoxin system VapC family toxin [Pseudomonas coronafaciens]KOP52917.1 twitching motility protein PilT [Pseudomonas coronafaciens pv. porri]KOP61336.1 twitching motility protein PilT [Pseudomonas coronafaciens pv. porri]KPY18108.1 PIN domain-containing protein [Pseudomonas coronafaciens pv. porri]RMU85165.1 PIN domain-containing protein [Pseudomonas coronafaciens pv. porri]RMV96478.1 PIN domain-containing protein [Pseudomonas coronafaciens pv. porri]